jgi:PAS domain S-box-containing protein
MREALAPAKYLHISHWTLFSSALIVVQAAAVLALNNRESRLAVSSAVLLLVLLPGMAMSARNALRSRYSIRLFWVLMTSALALWAVNPLLGIIYTAGPGRKLPHLMLSASVLFLHTVLLLAAVASRPHVKQLDGRGFGVVLDLMLILFFWVFLYVFFLLAGQYLNWNQRAVEWFSTLYFIENSVLVIITATIIARTRNSWKAVYWPVLGASSIYTCGSLVLNLKVAHGIYFSGPLDLLTTGAACVLVSAAIRGRELAPKLAQTAVVERSARRYPITLALLTVTMVPLLGLRELAQMKEPGNIHTVRLSAALVAGLLLTFVAFIREYLQQRKDVFDIGVAYDQLRLALQSGKSIGWDLNLSNREGLWFGDLRAFCGIMTTTWTGPARQFCRSIHPAHRRRMLRTILQAARNRTPYTAVFRVVLPGSSGTHWFTSRGCFYYNSLGKPIRMLGIAIDVNEQKQSEEALRESESRFRNMANAAPMLLWTSDNNQRREYFNQSWIDFTGQAQPADDWMECIHPEDRQWYLNDCREAFAARQPLRAEYRLKRYDGEYHLILENCVPRFTPGNVFEGYIGCGIDVTETRRAEKAIAVANERLHLALEGGSAEVWDLDMKTGESIRLGNHLALFGTPAGPQTLQEFWECVYPEDLSDLRKGIESAQREQTGFSEDFRVISPQGDIRWLHLEGKFIYSQHGEAERMLGITVDITERKRAAKALEESEEEFSLAFEAARLGWWVWNEETGRVVMSQGTREVLGLSSETEVTLDNFLNAVHPDDRERVYRKWWQSFDDGAHYLVEYRVLRPDGSVRWVEARGRAYSGSRGRLVQIVGVTTDITERKNSEEALRTLGGRLIQAQEQERIRISRELHDDICQRLALVGLELESLRDNAESEAPKLRDMAEHLVQFTAEIGMSVQALSHELHSSKLELLGIAPAIKSFCAEFSRQYHVKVEFGSNVAQTLPREVSLCLYRILQEALHNAVKHSGVREFFVQLRNQPGAVELVVRDFGAGFNVSAVTAGRGLGLVSMQERVNLVNGIFSVESEPQHGTTICARVPLEEERLAAA